jgi:hypothetical protein
LKARRADRLAIISACHLGPGRWVILSLVPPTSVLGLRLLYPPERAKFTVTSVSTSTGSPFRT